MKSMMTLLSMLLTMTLSACAQPAPAQPKPRPQPRPVIQLAILLDTSNSMDGLIDQARTQLWRVVNEFGKARKKGVMPELQVALYEYGNTRLRSEDGYIRRVLPFTTDLDRVSEELFALQTSGGDEYCGQVIDEAVRRLDWSASANDLRVIFIAGNEPFTQGPVDFKTSCASATKRGIIVNTIFCGDRAEGLDTHWASGAMLAEGRYIAIDQNAEVAHIAAPQDDQIAALGMQLNTTYIAYGAKGYEGQKRQSAQDYNLSGKTGANLQRQIAKASASYTNASWDLVDAKKTGQVDIAKVKTKDLPPEMQRMTLEQRKAHITAMEKKRLELQKTIARLHEERNKHIARLRRTIPPAQNTLDEAIITAVREAGKKRGFTF
jgi:hypothetical protein